MQTAYSGSPVFPAVVINGLVNHLIDEYVNKNLIAFMKQMLNEHLKF